MAHHVRSLWSISCENVLLNQRNDHHEKTTLCVRPDPGQRRRRPGAGLFRLRQRPPEQPWRGQARRQPPATHTRTPARAPARGALRRRIEAHRPAVPSSRWCPSLTPAYVAGLLDPDRPERRVSSTLLAHRKCRHLSRSIRFETRQSARLGRSLCRRQSSTAHTRSRKWPPRISLPNTRTTAFGTR